MNARIPGIHEWYPKLSIDAKHALQELDGGVIPDDVRLEIADVTGTPFPDEAVLSEADVDFIRTQGEFVD